MPLPSVGLSAYSGCLDFDIPVYRLLFRLRHSVVEQTSLGDRESFCLDVSLGEDRRQCIDDVPCLYEDL